MRRCVATQGVEHLAAVCDCPLVVVPAHAHYDAAQPVLLATDLSTDAVPAASFAFAMAAASDLPLHAVTVCPPTAETTSERRLQEWLEPLAAEHPEVETSAEALVGSAAERLLEAARSASLLVIGSRGQQYLRGTLRGSVGRSVARRSGRPTAVVRPPVALDPV